MGLSLQHYSITVKDSKSIDGFSDDGLVNSGVLVFVYQAGTRTLETIYADANATAKTNPISRAQFATDGKIDFYVADTSVDIFIADSKGNTHFASSVAPTQHTVKLQFTNDKHLVIPFTCTGSTEVDSGIDLPVDVKVTDCILDVVTVQSTKTLNVGLLAGGTGGNASGFLSAASIATAGFVANEVTTVGGSETYLSTSNYGALLGAGKVGADTAQHYGLPSPKSYIQNTTNGTRVSYTASSGTTSAAGYIHVYFRHIR